jgi:23S rRNA pseudouridine1911/1915/1917 synthase
MIFPIPSEFNNQSLRTFFVHHHLGRATSYNLEQAKALFINGNQATLETILHINDELLVLFETIDEPTHEAVHQPIEIVYEDRDLVVVAKEAGFLVHSDGNPVITLSNIVQAHYHETGIITRCLHRLDVETTGMVLFSKHLLAHASFSYLFESHQIKKNMCVCVKGVSKERAALSTVRLAAIDMKMHRWF